MGCTLFSGVQIGESKEVRTTISTEGLKEVEADSSKVLHYPLYAY